MAVRVDEPRANDTAGGLDHALGAASVDPTGLYDPAALDRDIAAIGRGAAAVDDQDRPRISTSAVTRTLR